MNVKVSILLIISSTEMEGTWEGDDCNGVGWSFWLVLERKKKKSVI